MEKIIIISDSHKNYDYIKTVVNLEKDVNKIFHLGDDYTDMDNITEIPENTDIIRVPGLFDPAYSSKQTPNIVTTEIYNWKFLLVHHLDEALRTAKDTDFYCFGHTHHWKLEERWGHYFLNPGHIKREVDRGFKASYCLLSIEKAKLRADFKYLDGSIFFTNTINKPEEK